MHYNEYQEEKSNLFSMCDFSLAYWEIAYKTYLWTGTRASMKVILGWKIIVPSSSPSWGRCCRDSLKVHFGRFPIPIAQSEVQRLYNLLISIFYAPLLLQGQLKYLARLNYTINIPVQFSISFGKTTFNIPVNIFWQ